MSKRLAALALFVAAAAHAGGTRGDTRVAHAFLAARAARTAADERRARAGIDVVRVAGVGQVGATVGLAA